MPKILVVGQGSIGQRHLRLTRELMPDAELAVLSRYPAAVEGVTCCSDLAEALAFEPDIAIVANDTARHVEVAAELAERGVHLLVEKPISHRVEEAVRLLEVAAKSGSILSVGYNLRLLPTIRHFRELIGKRHVGDVFSVRAEVGHYLPSWRGERDYRTAVSASVEKGGGVILELSHEIDYLRWIFGEIDAVSCIEARAGDLEIDVEDTAHLVLSTLTTENRRGVKIALNMDFIRHDTTRTCVAIGSEGTLRLDAVNGTVDCCQRGSQEWETIQEVEIRGGGDYKTDSYRLELERFFASVADKSSPLVTGVDGLRVLEIVEAARKSAATGAVAKVNHIEVPLVL
ncbi:Gfo/Idh/MocA family oxidoreductase [Verrucomicrobiales bacterium]|nr:Gfo/Idh/MocA family oxidoreductase [Verrucomicrobiales bacterium]